MKLAVTEMSAVSVTMQVPVPEQPPPLQPVKVEPEAADAVSVTTVLELKTDEHAEPQSIPVGLLVTVPLPAPVLLTVKVQVGCGPPPSRPETNSSK